MVTITVKDQTQSLMCHVTHTYKQIQRATYAGRSRQTLNQETHRTCCITYDVNSLVVSGITQITAVHLAIHTNTCLTISISLILGKGLKKYDCVGCLINLFLCARIYIYTGSFNFWVPWVEY